MKFRKTLIAGIAVLIPLAAMAGEGYDKSGKSAKSPTFDSLDANHDGRISPAEAAVDSKIVFSAADANGDGYLDKAEFKASMKGGTQPAPQTEPASPVDPRMPQNTAASSAP